MSVVRHVNAAWTPTRHLFVAGPRTGHTFKYENRPDCVAALEAAYIILNRKEWNHISDNIYEYSYNGETVIIVDNGKTVNINGKNFKV